MIFMSRQMLAAGALFAGLLALPSTAHARKNVVGASMGYGINKDAQDLRLRYGMRWKLATVLVQPELLGGIVLSDGESTPLAMVGLTVGAGPVLQPQVFARAGLLLAGDAMPIRQELGAALVFTSIPKLDMGLTASYNGVLADGSMGETWWSGGVEATLAF